MSSFTSAVRDDFWALEDVPTYENVRLQQTHFDETLRGRKPRFQRRFCDGDTLNVVSLAGGAVYQTRYER